ncbi:MAG TPA: DUF4424 family protein [Candidatus Angelobacter sp.]|nr:DUF4424 family protein [Candidatus Angelobacter sp.]
MNLFRLLAVVAVCLAMQALLYANDSAASSAAGGIQFKREPRISMAKEKLIISTKKITVEYEFINESDQDITTEVAFPIPAYKVTMSAGGIRNFNDFHLWVEGAERKYQIQAKAMLKTKDCSFLLQKYGIDIASLGHFEEKEESFSRDFRKLTKAAQEQLIKADIFDSETQFPNWSVEKTYYWSQTFPAHKALHIRHEYEPGIGFKMVEKGDLANAKAQLNPKSVKAGNGGYPPPDQFAREVRNACIDSSLNKVITKSVAEHEYVEMAWVDYILTTANNWKKPIKNFELIVEKDSRPDYPSSFVSFCWEGKVQKLGQKNFKAAATDFVPKADLHVAFFGIPAETSK